MVGELGLVPGFAMLTGSLAAEENAPKKNGNVDSVSFKFGLSEVNAPKKNGNVDSVSFKVGLLDSDDDSSCVFTSLTKSLNRFLVLDASEPRAPMAPISGDTVVEVSSGILPGMMADSAEEDAISPGPLTDVCKGVCKDGSAGLDDESI